MRDDKSNIDLCGEECDDSYLERFVRKYSPVLLIAAGTLLGAAATVMYDMDPEVALQHNTAFALMYTGSALLMGRGIIDGIGDLIVNYREKK